MCFSNGSSSSSSSSGDSDDDSPVSVNKILELVVTQGTLDNVKAILQGLKNKGGFDLNSKGIVRHASIPKERRVRI